MEKEIEREVISLEGVLKSIKEVNMSYVEKIQRGYNRVITAKTTLVLSTGFDKTEEIIFPGIVFPDSIGNKIKYSKRGVATDSTTGTPMRQGFIHSLEDQNNNRTYKVLEYDPC